MTILSLRRLTVSLLATCAVMLAAQTTPAVPPAPPLAQTGFGIIGAFEPQDEPVTFSARFTAATDDRPALLAISAHIAPDWHVYSLTQPPGGPQKTIIEVEPSPKYKVTGPFRAHPEPKSRIDNEIWVGLEIQEHADEVTWYAPIELADGVDPRELTIHGTLDLQVCKESCIPIEEPFTARLGTDLPFDAAFLSRAGSPSTPAPLAGPTFQGRYRPDDSEVQISGRIVPAAVRPGETAQLEVTATPSRNWHVYARADRDEKAGTKPTLIAFESTSGLKVGKPTTDAAIVEEDMSAIGFGIVRYHKGPVTWTADIQVPKDAEPGQYMIAGIIGFQACESTDSGLGSCELPKAARFQATVEIGDVPGSAAHELIFAEASYSDAAKAAAATPFLGPLAPIAAPSASVLAGSGISLLAILGFALVGGLILNVMPCVLPVIGLKIMAFAEQGGESRGHIFALNLAYAAGLIGVFLILATLASLTQLGLARESFGWGELYTLLWFKVAMIALVFAMALSFLGVWELPIPGFAGTGTAARLATQEGYSGAIFKGIFTTILATPCSGPFLGPVFGYTLAQPAWMTYLIFLFVGLGMAAPYLVIGAFPALIRWLPRPGAWMETLKQLMGFLLLGTVVYLFSTIAPEYFIATLAMLVGIWFACWWVGRTPLTAPDHVRYSARFGGVTVAALVGWAAFNLLTPSEHELPWQPYSPAALAEARAQGKTVLVDFTADWCPTCKTNLKFALNRRDVRELVERNDVVALVADWTDRNPMIKAALEELGSRSIPLLAVYPADLEKDVIVLPDLVTQGDVLAALEQAGPSRTAAAASGSMATIGGAAPAL